MGNQHFAVLDAGRALVKGKVGQRTISYVHALKELNKHEYDTMREREDSKHLFKVNGKFYAVGPAAISQGYQYREVTGNRYTKGYLGVLAAITLFRLYDKPIKGVGLYVCHPPSAIEQRKKIIKAVKGTWTVECLGVKRVNIVDRAWAVDEPVAGVSNLLLTDTGNAASSVFQEGATLVLDVGGETLDGGWTKEGLMQYDALRSVSGGIMEVERAFEGLLKGKAFGYPDVFQGALYLEPEKIRKALQTCEYDAGGFGVLDCEEIVERATRDILNRLYTIVESYNGFTRFNNVVFTGGGSGLLFDRIKDRFRHEEYANRLHREFFHLAAPAETVHLANAQGAYKMLQMFRSKGAI